MPPLSSLLTITGSALPVAHARQVLRLGRLLLPNRHEIGDGRHRRRRAGFVAAERRKLARALCLERVGRIVACSPSARGTTGLTEIRIGLPLRPAGSWHPFPSPACCAASSSCDDWLAGYFSTRTLAPAPQSRPYLDRSSPPLNESEPDRRTRVPAVGCSPSHKAV